MSKGYAYIDGQWRSCVTPYTELAGCSERELHLLASELRKRNRVLHGRERVEITQKQLANFRRENTTKEIILRQQRNDRETKAALAILEDGHRTEASACERLAQPLSTDAYNMGGGPPVHRHNPPNHASTHGDKLVVLRRIR